jgi:hypothetical protein
MCISRLKVVLRVGGILVAACGLLFLGSDFGTKWSHPGQTSAFTEVARTGAFAQIGGVLLLVGAVAFFVSLIVPGRIDDVP